MKRLTSLLFCAGSLWFVGAPASRADFTENLLARWTFNKPGPAALVDDVQPVALQALTNPDAPADLKFNADGTLTMIPPSTPKAIRQTCQLYGFFAKIRNIVNIPPCRRGSG